MFSEVITDFNNKFIAPPEPLNKAVPRTQSLLCPMPPFHHGILTSLHLHIISQVSVGPPRQAASTQHTCLTLIQLPSQVLIFIIVEVHAISFVEPVLVQDPIHIQEAHIALLSQSFHLHLQEILAVHPVCLSSHSHTVLLLMGTAGPPPQQQSSCLQLL
ncbi:hypothetical protein E2C01_016128 [Portunus trituberculatus]|uniref:Uncharacterized protein n=1 Tax=Portunus trituberculatus TaxID=210409 RepID=A0A5B7DNL4_PORTR|nr:hypothetical protein [Portunus trituberculatus]